MLDTYTLPAGAPITPPLASPVVGDVPDGLLAKLNHILAGGTGVELVANTTARAYRTLGFIVTTNATFAAVTADAGYSATGITGAVFPAGLTLPFRLSAFTLTSGAVLAIKA